MTGLTTFHAFMKCLLILLCSTRLCSNLCPRNLPQRPGEVYSGESLDGWRERANEFVDLVGGLVGATDHPC